MLILYFSGTGNTKYLANLFSHRMNIKCFSIESDINFKDEIKAHKTITFCYPIYCSRVPLIMREFVHKYKKELVGKKIIILVTQMFFSGDGARVFTDMFKSSEIDVIYAEHFNMPLNMGNTFFLDPWKPTKKSIYKATKNVKRKLNYVCKNIRKGVKVKRGFSLGSILLGFIQGKVWQKDTKSISASRLELKMKKGVKIHKECTQCNLCVKICPMKNLKSENGKVYGLDNCTACFRCVNKCPQKAITVFVHRKPKWQYKGV